jgi:hypothetical protein
MRLAPLFLVALVGVLGAPIAVAQPRAPAPPSAPAAPALADVLKGQALADYQAARMLFGVGDFGGAIIKFTAAYTASHDPRLLFNMAICESKLHHYARALGVMRTYVVDGGAMLSDSDRAEAVSAIKAFEPLTSTVTLKVDPPGAIVAFDDETLGPAPIEPRVVDIGVHKLRVTKPEFRDFVKDVTVTGAGALTVDAKLEPIVHEGRLSVRAGSGDTISLDGAPVGKGNWAGPLHSGGHTLRISAPGMVPYQGEILVEDGQARDLNVTLDPEPSKGLLPAWAWIGGGVLVAGGLGVGGYFLFKQSPKYDGPVGNLGPGVVQAGAPVHF